MRVMTLNLNGLRSAASKGLFEWLPSQDADLLLFQETRTHSAQRPDHQFVLPGYQRWFSDATAKGYSGVAIYSRRLPDEITSGILWPEFDEEGRWIEARFGNLHIVSLYLPSGSSSELRQAFKFVALDRLKAHFSRLRQNTGHHYIIGGDWNIAHRAIDLKNWRSNQKNSGFLPAERAWMDELLGASGWVDSYRVLHPETAAYTWWSNRGQAYANDVGWRIDYQIISPELKETVRQVQIHRTPRFSDHAPYVVDYAI